MFYMRQAKYPTTDLYPPKDMNHGLLLQSLHICERKHRLRKRRLAPPCAKPGDGTSKARSISSFHPSCWASPWVKEWKHHGSNSPQDTLPSSFLLQLLHTKPYCKVIISLAVIRVGTELSWPSPFHLQLGTTWEESQRRWKAFEYLPVYFTLIALNPEIVRKFTGNS